jgi:nucleotide-binding universal stress UspA family protein
MIKRILVALSGTPFTPSAVKHAIELAKAHEAELTGVTIVDIARMADIEPRPIGGGAVAHDLTEQRVEITKERVEQVVTDFENACRDAGMQHCVVRETGDVMEELMSLWRYHDLTIFGLRGLFEYGVIRRPDDAVTRLIAKGVRPIIAVAEEYRPIKRVLVAYNGSMESAKAMKRFVQLRLWEDIELKIACFGFADEDAEPLLTAAATYCRTHGLEPHIESVEGYPEEGLLKHARHWEADLVVMGSTARSRIMKLILGDTALHAMQHADMPLFLSQ